MASNKIWKDKELDNEIMDMCFDIPIILYTRFSERIDEKSAEEMGIKAFVIKPIMMKERAKTVLKILD